MNLLLILCAVMLIAMMAAGYENGMVRQFVSLVSMIFGGMGIVLVVNGLKYYMNGQIINVIVMVVLLAVTGIVSHVLGAVLAPAKLLAKLPIIKGIDKLLGVVFGGCETVALLWLVYTLTMKMDLGMVAEVILEYTAQSPILCWLYENNLLAYYIEEMLSAIV